MYCTVLLNSNRETHHTKIYLYKTKLNIFPGATVLLPTKNTKKPALIHSVYKAIPNGIHISDTNIKSITTLNPFPVKGNIIREYILALIDEYKDGLLTKEDFYTILESFVRNNHLFYGTDHQCKKVLGNMIPDACTIYIDEPGDPDEKELGFWKIIKDCEYLLRFGHTYFSQISNKTLTKTDPIVYTDAYLRIELKLEQLIRKEIGDKPYLGFCHLYWNTKKRILKEQFNLDWKTPAELNPDCRFD